MKNLNESLRPRPEDTRRDTTADSPDMRSEAEVIPFDVRRTTTGGTERQLEELRTRWTGIQAGFVDEPRKAVQEADDLVSSAIQQISEAFRSQRAQLEKQWNAGGDVSTEDLRQSFQHYRNFFDRLITGL
jgi:hypothetical protein